MHLHRHRQVAHHAADDGQLLVVLLSEKGVIGTKEVEELEHHRADSVEVAGAGRSTEVSGEEVFPDGYGMVGGIELAARREERGIHPERPASGEIGLELPRIGGQVGGAVKLEGIDEDGNQNRAFRTADLPRRANQGPVTLVEGPHGGNQGEGAGEPGDGRRGLGGGRESEHGDFSKKSLQFNDLELLGRRV